MFAAHSGNLPIIKALINKEANINLQDQYKFNSLLYALKANHDFAVIYLISK